jgi:hypothetical protein
MNSHLHRELAMAHVEEARRHAMGRRRAAAVRRRRPIAELMSRAFAPRGRKASPLPADTELRIRYARADDADALARLAALDGARVPPAPVILAEVGGEPWAARSLATGDVVADPFRRSGPLVELLALRAEQLRAASVTLDTSGRAIGPSEAKAR